MKLKKVCSLFAFTFLCIFNLNTNHAQELHFDFSKPIYNPGISALNEFITQNNNYRVDPGKNKNSGVVTVSYIINKDGNIEDIKILRGINAKYDSEAVRITKLIKGWKPARQMGKAVEHKVIMPIEFALDDLKKEDSVIITGKPIEGAFVLVSGTSIGAVTNSTGLYSINITNEECELEFSSIGSQKKYEKVGKNRTINAELLTDYLWIDFSSN